MQRTTREIDLLLPLATLLIEVANNSLTRGYVIASLRINASPNDENSDLSDLLKRKFSRKSCGLCLTEKPFAVRLTQYVLTLFVRSYH
ncbi:MAG: hypothetical protein C5B44_01945 [Acidobacteria bacterium]|nr:MAG: hypothetical protein C5B44_01945 [Acidobacteriota bacterium]